MYAIQATTSFLRTAQKFFKRHPKLKIRFEYIIKVLQNDPANFSLKLHALKGELKGLSAVRLTYKYRITFIIKLKQKKIILIDIDSHDEVY